MASGTLPAPGAQYGPCLEPCGHVDCAESRRMAAEACVFCGKVIGYDTPLYNMSPGLAHALCAEQAAERTRKETE